MTDISELRKDDRIIFSNGHESRVLRIGEDEKYSFISFINLFGREQDLYFLKKTGRAEGTGYEIVKIIHA